jgi:hypothetical protein
VPARTSPTSVRPAESATVLSMAIPVGMFVLMVYALRTWLVREADPFHLGLLAGTAAVLVAAVWLAAAGVPMAWCLLVVTLARR